MQRYGWIILGVVVLILALVNGVGSATMAPPTASPTWPRVAPPTLTPTPSPTIPVTTSPVTPTTPAAAAPSNVGAGALIWLRVQCSSPCQSTEPRWQALWTVVQWQDAVGDWHDVAGWRGPLDEVVKGEGRKVWGLSEALLGAGPFRWVVYQSQQGELLVSSAPFDLPDHAGKMVMITVKVDP